MASLALACRKHTPPPSRDPSAKDSADAQATLPVDPRVDLALLDSLKSLAQSCDVEIQSGNVNCAQGEEQKVISRFSGDQGSQIAALPTMIAALKTPEPRVQTVAANVLYLGFRAQLGRDARPGAISSEDAHALLTSLLPLPQAQSRQAIATAVHACELAGQCQELYAALDLAQNEPLATIAYRHLMTYGRLGAFDKIKQLSLNPDTALVLAALDSPTNMFSWTEDERARICPWAQGFMTDSHPAIAAKSAAVVAHCGGQYIDAMLDAIERSAKEKRLSRAEVSPMRDICTPAFRAPPGSATDAQCARDRKLLERIVEADVLEPASRGASLEALAYEWPDDHSLKLAKRYESSKEVILADFARQTVERLEKRKSTGASAAATAAGAPSARNVSAKPKISRVPSAVRF